MTHFTVLVIGEDVDKILAPYNENMEVKPYITMTKKEVIDEFHKLLLETRAKKSLKKLVRKEIIKLAPGESEFIETDENDEFLCRVLDLDITDPEQFRQWVKDYYGNDIDEDGNVLSTYNPQSKWDWYQIGGRWIGTFPLKKGGKGERGEPSATLDRARVEYRCVIQEMRVDRTRVGYIDWDLLNSEYAHHAGEQWDSFMNLTAKSWFGEYKKEYMISERDRLLAKYGSRDEYVRRTGRWTPYAVVNKDGWFAPGKMGWFGMSSESEDESESFKETFFEKFIKSLPKNTMVTMVDCHI